MKKKSTKSEEPRRRRQKSSVADWGGIDAESIRRIVSAITKIGGAVRFGYSKDGGAYSVGIYGDGKPFTEFHPEDEGVSEWLEGIAFDYE